VKGLFAEAVDVLVIEEDDAVRGRVAEGIRETGCSVEEARDRFEAAIVMKLWPVRALVLGAKAPGIDELLSLVGGAHPPLVIRVSETS
jgi:DNA-binding response OmpR family regulator